MSSSTPIAGQPIAVEPRTDSEIAANGHDTDDGAARPIERNCYYPSTWLSCCNTKAWLPEEKARASERLKKVAIFTLSLLALGALFYFGSKALDLNIDFKAQAGGIAMGGVIALIFATGLSLYYQRKFKGRDIRYPDHSFNKMLAFIILASAAVLALGFKAPGFDFTATRAGLAIGFAITAIAIKIVRDLRETAAIKRANDGILSNPDMGSIVHLKTLAAFIVGSIFISGAFLGGAHLLGADLASHATSISAGAITAIVAAGALYVISNRRQINEKERWILLVVAIVAAVGLYTLQETSVFKVTDAFDPWQGAIVGLGFTAVILTVTGIYRRKAHMQELYPDMLGPEGEAPSLSPPGTPTDGASPLPAPAGDNSSDPAPRDASPPAASSGKGTPPADSSALGGAATPNFEDDPLALGPSDVRTTADGASIPPQLVGGAVPASGGSILAPTPRRGGLAAATIVLDDGNATPQAQLIVPPVQGLEDDNLRHSIPVGDDDDLLAPIGSGPGTREATPLSEEDAPAKS